MTKHPAGQPALVPTSPAPAPVGDGYISSLSVTAPDRPRRLAVLGATGSIGVSALRVAAEHPPPRWGESVA